MIFIGRPGCNKEEFLFIDGLFSELRELCAFYVSVFIKKLNFGQDEEGNKMLQKNWRKYDIWIDLGTTNKRVSLH